MIDNPLIKSRPHIQQTRLLIVYIMNWFLVDLLLHHTPHFKIDHSLLKSGLFGGPNLRGMKSGDMCLRVWMIGISIMLFPYGASASGLACKQKDDILNIFFNSIRKPKLLRNFSQKY